MLYNLINYVCHVEVKFLKTIIVKLVVVYSINSFLFNIIYNAQNSIQNIHFLYDFVKFCRIIRLLCLLAYPKKIIEI